MIEALAATVGLLAPGTAMLGQPIGAAAGTLHTIAVNTSANHQLTLPKPVLSTVASILFNTNTRREYQTGLDTTQIVLFSDKAAPNRSDDRMPCSVRPTSRPKAPDGIASRSACLIIKATSASSGTAVSLSRMEAAG